MNRFRRLLPYAYRQWRLLVIIASLTICSSLAVAMQPWPLKILIDHAIQGQPLPAGIASVLQYLGSRSTPTSLVLFAGIASLVIVLVSCALEAGLTWVWAIAGQRMVGNLTADLFARLQRLSFSYHREHTIGDSLERITGDAWCVYKLTDGILIGPTQRVLTLATLGVVAWRLNAQLAATVLLTAPLMAWTSVKFGQPLKRRARMGREVRAKLVSFVQQTLSSMPLIQAFGTEDRNRDRFEELAADSVSISQRGALLASYYGLVTGLIAVAGTAVVIYAGSYQVLKGALSIGSFLVFVAYLKNLQSAAEGLVKVYGELKPLEASVDRVLEVLDSPHQDVSETSRTVRFSRRRKGSSARVVIDNVSFGYVEGVPVLQEVSCEAMPGHVIALVGKTGAGKSTLVSLLPRFYDPWSGRIELDGRDIRDLPVQDLRSRISLVFQDSFLLPLTIAENIAYGSAGATDEAVIAAARVAQADTFIRRLPQGYDTLIGERGVTLSGGERQRLAIARAILRDAPVLIMDEPTSALDPCTETSVLDAFNASRHGRTIFVIAHRLSTVRSADLILVMEKGRIVERGNHQDLVASDGIYARSLRLQAPSGRLEVLA